MVGDADEDDVWFCSGHLLARPTRRTFVLASLRTDRVPQMLDAVARLAVAVLDTWVEEATGTGLTLDKRRIGTGIENHFVKDEGQLHWPPVWNLFVDRGKID